MAGEYEKLLAQLSKREWHGKNYLWFPIGFGWALDFEWGKANNDSRNTIPNYHPHFPISILPLEKTFHFTIQVVKPK